MCGPILQDNIDLLAGKDTPPPSRMKTIFYTSAIVKDIVSGRIKSYTIQNIEGLRTNSDGHGYFKGDPKRIIDLYGAIKIHDNKVELMDDVIVNRNLLFSENPNTGKAELIAQNHDVSFLEAWVMGFHFYHVGEMFNMAQFIEGRDILISAALLSIMDILKLFKENMEAYFRA